MVLVSNLNLIVSHKIIIFNNDKFRFEQIKFTLRILLNLEALNDQQVWNPSEYHKVQGFVYDKLIANTEFKEIHNLKSYKFFCYSNIFPQNIFKK